jgi:hypothetical protein
LRRGDGGGSAQQQADKQPHIQSTVNLNLSKMTAKKKKGWF